MKVIIVGCGKMGAKLAYRLYQKSHDVTIVDKDKEAFGRLSPDFSGRLIEGDGLNEDVLLRAGIESADALASLTNLDPVNLVVGHIAQKIFRMTNVVVRNYHPGCRSLYEDFGLQAISASSWGAQRVEEMIHHNEFRAVFSAGNGEVEVYEILVPEGWSGFTLGDLFRDQHCQLVALTKGGKAILPTLEEKLTKGDIILISATNEGVSAIRDKLSQAGVGGGS